MAGKRSKDIDVWILHIENLLAHCSEGKEVPPTCKVSINVNEETNAFIDEHSSKFGEQESQLFIQLQDYLSYFDGDISGSKPKIRAKQALNRLHPLVKWLEEHGALKVDIRNSNEETPMLIKSMEWIEALLNALKEVIDKDDWDRWTKRISQKKKDAKRDRIPINKKVKEYLEDRQAFFDEPSLQAFTDKLGEKYDICSVSDLERQRSLVEKLEKQIASNQKILTVLEDSGNFYDALKALIAHDVKVKANQKYRIGKMKPVQDGVDHVVSKLTPVEDESDFILVDLDSKREK
ncbi:hypothetical protein [Aliiglaciecola lipolytica]|uniref:Uncharacterized protein n=1 Tax=Aliiglaciecola lipolytica E3 TaxID=1127673 RepID=K6Y695_9ALTE|nr:hypothetical protein [Aliiglaciecola lipolytica]GAC13752.1 hypothetical protein GLIP_1110 [Aliiglaciecola lipolytica E3]